MVDAVQMQIDILNSVNEMPLSYIDLIEGSEVADEDISKYRKCWLHQKCLILSLALCAAKEKMPFHTWENCCKDAIDEGKHFGVSIMSCPCTVQNWYAEFREKCTFQMYIKKKDKLSPFLNDNKDICQSIQQYACKHLN